VHLAKNRYLFSVSKAPDMAMDLLLL